MFTKTLGVLLMFSALLCVATLVGCEGDQGPAGPAGPTGPTGPTGQPGPNTLLAYADVLEDGTVAASGPSGIAVSVTKTVTGQYSVTVDGTFPSTAGVLLTTTSSNASPFVDCVTAGRNMGWSTSQITFLVYIYCPESADFFDNEFSFAIVGE